MKCFNPVALFLLLTALCACETFNEEEQVICLPVNMTATVIQGTETKKVIADLHYIPETVLLDHITWSNHQTHYFEYDEMERMHVVRQVKVDAKVQEEMWFIYDGTLVKRIDLVTRNLDYTYLEPLDSIYSGYIEYTYEGQNIIEEDRYEITQGGMREEYVWNAEYEYDQQGNMLSSRASDPRTSSEESVQMTYDLAKHPFSHVQYYFNGESFVNNLLSKTITKDNFNYSYESHLNEHGYPETINEKLGTSNTRVIRYSYIYL